jgi:hypothetical protein
MCTAKQNAKKKICKSATGTERENISPKIVEVLQKLYHQEHTYINYY